MVINTKLQDQFLDEFFSSRWADDFYLTGGTALARFYFHHRESVDLDLFTNNQQIDFAEVNTSVRGIVEKLKLKVIKEIVTGTFIQYISKDRGGSVLKVDLVKDTPVHFGKVVRKGKMRLDSVENVGSNKMVAIFGRTDGKDFVDLYMIVKEAGFSFEELYRQAKQKDLGLAELYLAEALHQVGKIKQWPKLSKPIDRQELVKFYTRLSRKLLKQIKPQVKQK